MFVYIDDVLQFAKDVQEDMLKPNQVYQVKEGFGPPYRYIGDSGDKVRL